MMLGRLLRGTELIECAHVIAGIHQIGFHDQDWEVQLPLMGELHNYHPVQYDSH